MICSLPNLPLPGASDFGGGDEMQKGHGQWMQAGTKPFCLGYKMDVSENCGTPKSSILIGFSIINHPFWGTPIFGNLQMLIIDIIRFLIGYWFSECCPNHLRCLFSGGWIPKRSGSAEKYPWLGDFLPWICKSKPNLGISPRGQLFEPRVGGWFFAAFVAIVRTRCAKGCSKDAAPWLQYQNKAALPLALVTIQWYSFFVTFFCQPDQGCL